MPDNAFERRKLTAWSLSMKRIERESHREISDDIKEIMSVKAVA